MEEFLGDFLLVVCNIFNTILNPGIVALAFYEVGLVLICGKRLYAHKAEILDLNGKSKKKRQAARKTGRGKVTTTYEATIERDWARYDEFRQKYQDSLSVYNKFILIIQLFPLLGILGTVAGLYIAMNSHDGAESLYAGVGFALSSTIWGLISAIFFKGVDVFLSNLVNVIDDNVDRYEKNYTVESHEARGNVTGSEPSPSVEASTSAQRG